MSISRLVGALVQTAITFVVLTLLAIVAFYVTVFVVSTGAGLAGYDPSGDFVVLSASLLVVAALLGGVPFWNTSERQSPHENQESVSGFH